MSEQQRITFIEQHMSHEAAVDFAKRSLRIYRQSILRSRKRGFDKPHHASLPEYRRGFIESYLTFKRYIAAHK